MDGITTARAEQLFPPGDFVSGKVVHKQNSTGLECRNDTLLNGAVKHSAAMSDQPITARVVVCGLEGCGAESTTPMILIEGWFEITIDIALLYLQLHIAFEPLARLPVRVGKPMPYQIT